MVRNGTYYHRVKVPRDIVDRYGKRIEVVSLRTKDRKVAKARNARMTADLNEKFDQVRAASITAELRQESAPLSAERIASITRAHAARIEEQLLVDRVELFEAAVADPRRLWKGELIKLPDDADGENFDPAFAHLVEDGELSPVLAYLNRIRLKRRLETLRVDLKAGNLQSFVAMARDGHGVTNRAAAIRLAKALAEAEIGALEALLAGQGERPPKTGLVAGAGVSAPAPMAPSLDRPFRRPPWRSMLCSIAGEQKPSLHRTRFPHGWARSATSKRI